MTKPIWQADLESAASRGAKLLDRVKKSWHKEIDLDNLNLASERDCVLGQLFFEDGPFKRSGYELGLDHLTQIRTAKHRDDEDEMSAYYGFSTSTDLQTRERVERDYPVLTQAWTKEIKRRLKTAA